MGVGLLRDTVNHHFIPLLVRREWMGKKKKNISCEQTLYVKFYRHQRKNLRVQEY